MRHYCTYFDRNYLYRALALHESLVQHGKPFRLWALCFDDIAYDVLVRLSLPNVHPITLDEFESADPELVAIKPTRYPREYYWTSTAPLILYTLHRTPPNQVVAYLDSDLYFFFAPEALFTELGEASILLIEHRYALAHAAQAAISGIYNVGMLLFRHDTAGLDSLHWWRERCIEWCYARPDNGRFGDQKYLDEFPGRFPNVRVSQNKGANLAPWNIPRYSVTQRGSNIHVDDDRLVFYHFHSLTQISRTLYEKWAGKYRVPRRSAALIYAPYLHALQHMQARVLTVAPSFRIDYPKRGPRSLALAFLSGRLAYAKRSET